ncbi:MAG: pyridoxamine 5'-phosphate oxidase family protein [Chloroflexi bacterium]|nr:pyridoxamine 5'-phosphate oxidase family protein [Chloroflexota bacterium]
MTTSQAQPQTAYPITDDNRFTAVFGAPDPNGRAKTKVVDYMTDFVKEFIRQSPFVVMATSDVEGNCDASPKGGKPGFVKVLDDRHLVLPDVAGNRLFQSYLNMDENPHVGLIFMIPGVNDTVRVNGTVSIVNQDELNQKDVEVSLYEPDERGYHLQGIIIEVDEAYGHCPRALHFSRFWDIETIEKHKSERPVPTR